MSKYIVTNATTLREDSDYVPTSLLRNATGGVVFNERSEAIDAIKRELDNLIECEGTIRVYLFDTECNEDFDDKITVKSTDKLVKYLGKYDIYCLQIMRDGYEDVLTIHTLD